MTTLLELAWARRLRADEIGEHSRLDADFCSKTDKSAYPFEAAAIGLLYLGEIPVREAYFLLVAAYPLHLDDRPLFADAVVDAKILDARTVVRNIHRLDGRNYLAGRTLDTLTQVSWILQNLAPHGLFPSG